MKYIVIDGIKYKIDPSDATKALLDSEGKPVPYVEDTPPAPGKSLEDLAKENPEVARMLAEKKRLEDEAAERAEKEDQERQEALRKNGEFQTLAKEAEDRARKAKQEKDEAEAILGKYKGAINEIRDEMLSQIPEDRRGLVPETSAIKQVDYIRKNAEFLGVSLVKKKGSGVPPHEDTPPLDEEGRLTEELSVLAKKDNLTPTEQARMSEVAKLIKKIRAAKAQ